MQKLLLLATCFIITYSFGQNNFVVSMGIPNEYDEFYNVTELADGNYVATGYTDNDASSNNTYIVKFNKTGQQLWNKVIATGDYDEGFGITSTSDGGFAVSGASNNKMAISKFDAAGNLSWTKQYNELTSSDAGRLIQTSDGGYLLPGGISTDDFTTAQAYLIKTDASGVVQWSRRYFNTAYSVIYEIKKTNDNNYIFLALNYLNDTGGSDSAYIVKINSSGDVLWSKYFAASGSYTDGYSLTTTSDGGYLITGDVYNSSSDNGFILKIDGDGNYKWARMIASTQQSSSLFYSGAEASDGGYVAIGDAGTADSSFMYLVKVNSSGDLQWTKTIKRSDGDFGSVYKIIKTSDGGYLAAGSIIDAQGSLNALLTKFDGNLNSCKPEGAFAGLTNFGALATGTAPTYAGNTTTSADVVTASTAGSFTDICSALPLTLLNFSAAIQNNIVELKWKTSQEINTAYFDVEKSSDGKAFNLLTKVAASGNSNLTKTYAASDNNPLNGDNWYRLKMVDKDGQYSYSNVEKINFTGNSKAAFLYPNPAMGNAILQFNSNKPCNYTVELVDVSGKVLKTLKGAAIAGENKVNLNVSNYTKGVYLVKLSYDENTKVIIKLSKQ